MSHLLCNNKTDMDIDKILDNITEYRDDIDNLVRQLKKLGIKNLEDFRAAAREQGAAIPASIQNAVAKKFANADEDDWNEVLDVQRTVLKKQFVQSTLEMLSQSAVDSVSSKVNDFSSLRNGILSEISSNWESTAGSLGLAARRYDVLVQNDSERLSAASNLRPVLFDLYLSGLVAFAKLPKVN